MPLFQFGSGFFPPLYTDGNIGHSISPYSSHHLALSAEMEISGVFITVYP